MPKERNWKGLKNQRNVFYLKRKKLNSAIGTPGSSDVLTVLYTLKVHRKGEFQKATKGLAASHTHSCIWETVANIWDIKEDRGSPRKLEWFEPGPWGAVQRASQMRMLLRMQEPGGEERK